MDDGEMSSSDDCSESAAGRQAERSGSDCSGSGGEDSDSDRCGRGGIHVDSRGRWWH